MLQCEPLMFFDFVHQFYWCKEKTLTSTMLIFHYLQVSAELQSTWKVIIALKYCDFWANHKS